MVAEFLTFFIRLLRPMMMTINATATAVSAADDDDAYQQKSRKIKNSEDVHFKSFFFKSIDNVLLLTGARPVPFQFYNKSEVNLVNRINRPGKREGG